MKKLNKIISFVTSIVMALSMVVTVSAQEDALNINEHFEGDVSTTVWTGDYVVSTGINKTIGSASGKAQFYCRPGKTVESGAMVISYDVMLPALASVRIKQVWDAASSGKRPYYIQASSAGKLTINGVSMGEYTANKWFNLTEVVDVSEKKVDVYIDGVFVDEYDWYNSGEAAGINNIQTQYDGNMVYVDNAFVAEYDNKDAATAAVTAMTAGKTTLSNSNFTVAANSATKNLITPVQSGAVLVSYDMTATGKARLMQIYDNQASAKRTVLIQLNSSNVISVNGISTGATWEPNKSNNLTLIYNVADKTSTVYYNHALIGRENYTVHSDNGINLADIRTQDEGGNGITVSNAYAMAFASYEDAVKYHNATQNSSKAETLEYYGVSADDFSNAISEYSRDLAALTYTAAEKSAIINKMSAILPYTNIFSDNFNGVTETSGYTVSTDATVVDDKLKITNDGARARLLKSISSYDELIVECDFMQETISNVESVFRITDNQGQKEAVKFYASCGDIIMLYGPQNEDNSFNSKVLVAAYEANKWYNIKACADLSTKKVAVYVDDVFAGSYDFMYADIENMRRAFDSYTDSAGSYYIDNIRIYNDDIMSATTAIEVGSKATQNIDLPETVGNFECVWSTNNEDAITAEGIVNRPDEVSEDVVLTVNVSNGIASVDTKFNTRAAAKTNFEIGKIIYAGENDLSTTTKAGAIGIKFIDINKNNDEINANVIVAMYNGDGKFIDASIEEVKDGYVSVHTGFTQEVSKIKLLIWDEDTTNIVPYIETVEIN